MSIKQYLACLELLQNYGLKAQKRTVRIIQSPKGKQGKVPLHHVLCKSFETGKIPEQLKIAKIVPIHKCGDKTLPDNYRPISLLPNFSKILEKVVCIRLTNFLEENSVLTPNQFGFRKNHSTVHPLMHFINNLTKASNSKQYSIAIFCDLRKAFDTVDHSILLSKLNSIGVRGLELEWFKSYLCNRKQFVYIDGVSSPLLEIVLGVPQGSILGPLLFLIYINELPLYTSLINYLFADDTTLQHSHENLEILTEFINLEFQKITYFFRSHRLSLHPNKTKFMLFFNGRGVPMPNILINNNCPNSPNDPAFITPMECINTAEKPYVKFLGVLIDPQLNFKNHISHISSKLSKSMYFLRTAKNVLNEKALKFIYYSLIHSHLIYAIQIYSSTNQGNLNQLLLKQKSAVRIISRAKYNSHTEPLFKSHKILPFPKLCEYFRIQFMHNFTFNFLPISFNNMWTTNRDRRGNAQVELRDDDDFYIPRARTQLSSLQPLTLFPLLWANFPDADLKSTRNKLIFNADLKKSLLNQLSDIPICSRLLCPACHLPQT